MKDRITLTSTFIKGHPVPEKRTEHYDDVVTGMILRVTKTGYKSFALRYWYDEQSKQITIGKFGDITLAEARSKARELKKTIAEGKDPVMQRQAERKKKPITLGEYIDQFKSDYIERKLKASTQKTYKSRLNKVQANSISKIPLKKVSRSDVRKFLKAEAKDHPTNANRLHSILSKLFNEAIQDELLTKNPIKDMDKISDEVKRDPRYTDNDIKGVWNAICQEWEPMQSVLKMLLITGQRLGETSRMKWADIDNDVWIIPIAEQKTGKKTKRSHKVPLPKMALNLLEQMKPINGASEYVFASQRDEGKPLSFFKNAIDRIREETKLTDFRIHDLRHIVATGMINLDVPFTSVGKVLNHKALAGENTITARYVNTDLTRQKTEALNLWAGHLTELVSPLSLAKSS